MRVDVRDGRARLGKRPLELPQRDRLLLLGALDRILGPGDLGLETLAGAKNLEPLVIERRREIPGAAAELVAIGVRRKHREPRPGGPQRQLLPAEVDPRRQDRVLERVLALGQLRRDQPALAGLAQTVEPLTLVSGRRVVLRRP